jgi:hypothetical protein
METLEEIKNPKGLRIIKTGRTEEGINEAARNGFRPLIKKLKPSKKIKSYYSVFQNKISGEIDCFVDMRFLDIFGTGNFEIVIDRTSYYPYNYELPFAAYLIPPDIQQGERVIIEDLIEDYPGTFHSQGDVYRLESCEAIWNGTDFEIQYDPKINTSMILG